MQLIKLVAAGAIITALFTAAMIPSAAIQKSDEYSCNTDTECVAECLTKCDDKDDCRKCWDIFINEDNYDLYERKYSELQWKYEAY